MSIFGPFIAGSAALGLMVAILTGVFLPKDKSKELEHDDTWRYLFGFPLVLLVLQLIVTFTYYKEDKIKFCVNSGKYEEAERFIQKAYVLEGKDYTSSDILEHLKKNTSKKQCDVSLWEVMTSPKYRKATWIAFTIIVFHEFSGINVIMAYSHTILHKMDADGKGLFTPK